VSQTNAGSARALIAALAAKTISARELLDDAMARNAEVAGTLNCVVASDPERAQKAALAIDDARARGRAPGALAGLPMTVKDVFDVDGMPAVVGNPMLKDRPKACSDADLVARLKGEGAVIWGKTNVPLMAGDFQSYNSVYGTTNNPYDVSRTPGGSSGGAAVALATGITSLEIGSDIGGSLRHPANFCGVFSLKPTWGALSQRGHAPPLPEQFCDIDLNVVGPMARTADDLQLLWTILSGSAAKDRGSVKGARVIVWDEEPSFPLSRDVRTQVQRAADALQRRGAVVEHVKLPVGGGELMDAYLELLIPIIASGYPEALYESFISSREADLRAVREGSGDLTGARFRLRSIARHRDVLRAMTRRQALKDRMAAVFASGVDAILSPLGPVPAFPHTQDLPPTERTIDVDGRTVPYMSLLTWIALATALHLPAMAVPAGRNGGGLPIGVQVIGPWHREDRLFDFAAVLEEDLGGFNAPAV
jgi:amidase